MSKETILKEFDKTIVIKNGGLYRVSSIFSYKDIEIIQEIISKAIDQTKKETREETIREAIRKIEKIKIAVVKQTGAFKYNSCYEDCIDILNKLKK